MAELAGMRDFTGAAVDLLFGSACVSCARPGPSLCLRCGAVLEQLPFAAWPQPCPAGLPAPFAVTGYDGVAQAAVVAHKEHGVLNLAAPLGRALGLSVMAVLASSCRRLEAHAVVGLVGPPSTAATDRHRGHAALARIVRACVRSLRAAGVPVAHVSAIERVRAVADQAGLSAGERFENLGGAFGVRRSSVNRLAGRPLVVVDDVLTTGATAAEVARVLSAVGADVLGVAVIAATRRRARAQARPGTND